MKIEDFTLRASGRLVPVVEDGIQLYAFIPNSIPRDLLIPTAVTRLNEEAGLHLGKLFSACDILNPGLDLFLRREAIASNAIEGTITTARELYLFEVDEDRVSHRNEPSDRREVMNYVLAVQRGVEILRERPLSLNVINQLHEILLHNVRGQNKLPGQIRRRQNAISKGGFADARYVPPPASEVMAAMTDMEAFIHEDSSYPDLMRAALVHYQFEAVHPYLDGNGRLGRLLIPLLLSSWGKMPDGTPRLYLSKYFEQHNQEYRDRLLGVSQDGRWIEWIEFFLSAIVSESRKTLVKAGELMALRDSYIERVKSGPGNLQEVIRRLFDQPVLKIKDIASITNCSRAQAGQYAKRLVAAGILKGEDRSWGQHFYADEILRVFFEESN